MPKGIYVFNYQAQVNVDQFINIYRIDYKGVNQFPCPVAAPSTGANKCTWAPSITNANGWDDIPFIMFARQNMVQSAALPVTFYLQNGGNTIDTSEPITDTGDLQMASYEPAQTGSNDFSPPTNSLGGSGFQNPDLDPGFAASNTTPFPNANAGVTYNSYTLNRTVSFSKNAGGNKANWNPYRIVFKKNAGGNKTLTVKDFWGDEYTFYYNTPEMVQIKNLSLDVQFQAS